MSRSTAALNIRIETAADHAVVEQLVEAAFAKPDEAKLVRRLRNSDVFIAELSLVAEEDGVIVGHVLVSYVDLADADVTHRILSLAPLAVAPDAQRRGVVVYPPAFDGIE